MVFYRITGYHTKRSIIKAKVALIDVKLLLFGCNLYIQINIYMLFTIKRIEQPITNT